MRFNITILIVLICMGCLNSQAGIDTYNVQFRGALKNFMLQGDISAKADLDSLENTPNLYALGAVEDLKGEILVLDSYPLVSSVSDRRLIIEQTYNTKASLLVYASVESWDTLPVPDYIRSYREFEHFVENAARNKGINTENPFPFQVIGMADSIDWHIINWPDGDTKHSHTKHRQSGPHGTLIDEPVTVLGFYSKHHHAVFTHHTTNMHLHFTTEDNTIAGHLDDMVLGEDMMLMLPK